MNLVDRLPPVYVEPDKKTKSKKRNSNSNDSANKRRNSLDLKVVSTNNLHYPKRSYPRLILDTFNGDYLVIFYDFLFLIILGGDLNAFNSIMMEICDVDCKLNIYKKDEAEILYASDLQKVLEFWKHLLMSYPDSIFEIFSQIDIEISDLNEEKIVCSYYFSGTRMRIIERKIDFEDKGIVSVESGPLIGINSEYRTSKTELILILNEKRKIKVINMIYELTTPNESLSLNTKMTTNIIEQTK